MTASKMKFADKKSEYSTLVRSGDIPIGIVKKMGDRSFLSLKNVRDTHGKLILIKGGVYRVHRTLANSGSVIDINRLKKSERLFYPLTFMRDLDGPYTNREFKGFLSYLDEISEKTVKVKTPPKVKAGYLVEWDAAVDKEKFLMQAHETQIKQLLLKRWDQVPSPETYLLKLSPENFKTVLTERWESISQPQEYLSMLSGESLVEVLIDKWARLQNPEQYLSKIEFEYDVGKVLSIYWSRIKDPEFYLNRIQDDQIRGLVMRHKR